MIRAATTDAALAAAAPLERDERLPETTVHARAGRHVCMIAYTEYLFDGRVRREAETLVAHGFRVRCLTSQIGPKPARFLSNGVEVWELPVLKYRGKSTRAYLATYLSFALWSTLTCLRLMLRGELDVVHVHNIPNFLVVAGLVPRLAGRKVVLDVHDSVPETFATKFSRHGLVRKMLELEERLSAVVAHRVICVNHPQRDTLVSRGIPRTKTFVSMNVPDPSIFGQPAVGRRPELETGGFNLVYHGTMARRLGVDLIIQAVARMRSRVPGIRLHLWGYGDDLASFRHLAKELGVEDAVIFMDKGYPLTELPVRLRSMNIGVVGNRRSEAGDLMLPVKLVEYASMGIPAVVPRLRTIEHYFSSDMVTYFEPEDLESLIEGIERLLSDPQVARRQAERAAAFFLEHGWDRQGAALVDFYRQLVES